MSKHPSASHFHKGKTLNDKYLLGDEIGKGAYGRVYKGLDSENGDFVAIKQVSLENIPVEDLASIMQEIDLLKNLNHKNIVKYLGSFKTKTHLYILLEYVENGSLASIIKPNKFGAFPESLVAVYIAQVLEGLAYLHEQGVIHRDIKGANILTTKEGLVKLADFGVATKLTEADVNTHSVVGTPYWMAPEVIEMSGVSAASDIWSVGCTVIELLTCVPPYYDLQPMPALFRIVQDDHPPIPEHLSAGITDFMHQCFQKDAKRRPDAKTLLKHPWIQWNSRRALHNSFQQTAEGISNVPQDMSTMVERTIEGSSKDEQGSVLHASDISRENLIVKNAFSAMLDEDAEQHTFTVIHEAKVATSFHKSDKGGQVSSQDVQHKDKGGDSDQQDSGFLPPLYDSLVDGFSPMSGSEKDQNPTPLRSLQIAEPKPSLKGRPVEQEVPEYNRIVNGKGLVQPQRSRSLLTSGEEKRSELTGSLELTSHSAGRSDLRILEAELNGAFIPPQAGKSAILQELSRFSDTPADGNLDDLFEQTSERLNGLTKDEASGSVPMISQKSLMEHSSMLPDSKTNGLAAKLKAKMAQKRVEGETIVSAQKHGPDLFSAMINVVNDEEIDSNGLVFESKAEGRDYYAKQALEVTRLIGLLKPEESEEIVITACQKLISICRELPEQRTHLISQHGVMPILEMLELNNNRIVYAVLQLVNEIIRDNVEIQENACLVGLIPMVMNFSAPERSKEMRMQAAYFVQQLCTSRSPTLQMFVACRGLPVLVGFLEPDYAKYREMVHIAIDCMQKIFELQSATPKNDFCRIFAKNGALVRLVNTLHSLNEATRLAPAVMSNSATIATQSAAQRSRSGPLEQSRPFSGLLEHGKPRSGQLDPLRVRHGHIDQLRHPVGTFESSKLPSHHAYKSTMVQSEHSQRISGQLEPSRASQARSQQITAENVPAHYSYSRFDLSPTRHVDSDFGPQIDTDQSKPLLGNIETLKTFPDQVWQYEDKVHMPSGSSHGHGSSESSLPLLHHAGAIRKTSGELDMLLSAFAEKDELGALELIQKLPPSKSGFNGNAAVHKLSSGPLLQVSGNLSSVGEGIPSSSGLVSQSASGLLSGSGILNGKPGSATSSGVLSRMISTLNAGVAGEYLSRVADLLLEFSRGDTVVKAFMCSLSLLIRLFTMLNKLEPPILVKILKCIKQLSMDPYTLELLQRAEAMKHLVPLLESHEGPYVSQIHNQVLHALYNLCKINKRRQEQAAECGIIPHLLQFITTSSPLKQFALPLLCDMAHASRYTREQLRAHNGLEVYLSLLGDEYWAVTALDSLAVCVAHDNEHRKVEQALLKRDAVQQLVSFFQVCSGPSFLHILEPFLKIITKSARLNTALAVSGLTPLLVGRLADQDAIARLNILKLIKAVYEHHPQPKQLIVEHDLPSKLQRLIEERRDGEHSGGQVLVKQMAITLLKALHINTVL
ncbi:hypothetical protein O6H91_12G066000 [Diphasiastrum complanatum]|uniref:Uncharacterized protein n=1 Tax=Diphasiastrum complanatum TaxID=34168 RepID=A0ACC2C3G4_DIPCM|nr:hypothetical protein O6H91_12G066000 [Diphasiastrum complanatum]